MSAMSVCRSPAGTYACAVAGAPVTSWDGYDTHYTGIFAFVVFVLLFFTSSNCVMMVTMCTNFRSTNIFSILNITFVHNM